MASILGGGIAGLMPQSVPARAKGNGNAVDRAFARRVFNNKMTFQSVTGGSKTSGMLLNGGYRSVMNGGDALNRMNMSCGGSNQASNAVNGSANAAARNHGAGAVPQTGCGLEVSYGSEKYQASAATGANPIWSGNSRFVADSSDFTRFRKMRSVNRNYNDISFGGDQSNASQSILGRVRG